MGLRATFFLSVRANQNWRIRGISAPQLGQGTVRLHRYATGTLPSGSGG